MKTPRQRVEDRVNAIIKIMREFNHIDIKLSHEDCERISMVVLNALEKALKELQNPNKGIFKLEENEYENGRSSGPTGG